jgi:hypothetical protein
MREVHMKVFPTLIGIGVLAMLGTSRVSAAEESAPVQAVWKPQEISFFFQSFTTFYSCDSLESKLEQILSQLGAQADVKVRSTDCHRGPVRLPRADIHLISPVEATPEALAELKKNASTRELAARVSGDRAKAAELAEQFPAQWKRITVGKSARASGIESADCELLDQVRRKIVPHLAVRVIGSDAPCPTNSPSLTRPTLVVEALIEMPKPDEVRAQDKKERPESSQPKPQP